jgi:glycosyltransferase involved in cell wall biosynthesis
LDTVNVGIPVHGGSGWMGGLYYCRTIGSVLRSASGGRYRPVWITPRGETNAARQLAQNGDAVVGYPHNPPLRAMSRLAGPFGHRALSLEVCALQAEVDCIVPASWSLGRSCRVPWVGWMWDYQHEHLPEFFSSREVARRKHVMRRLAGEAGHLVVSSCHARNTALELFPWLEKDLSVLSFPSIPEDDWYAPDPMATVRKHNVDERFFFLPNQFWTHKNHRVVFDAWALLGRSAPMLVCTGGTEDHRRPGHLNELRAVLGRHGIEERVKILGLLPRSDQVDLYRTCMAVLNPSLYEGWSTTVEEARSLAKPLILSDIAIFKEQAPTGATFFRARDPANLAEVVRALGPNLRPGPDRDAETRERTATTQRVEAYREVLVGVVTKAMEGRRAARRFVI